jgi:hypothetical protein
MRARVWLDDPARRDDRGDVLVDPLHPMHVELLHRVGRSGAWPAAPVAGELPRPLRWAIVFHSALASWIVLSLGARAALRWIGALA